MGTRLFTAVLPPTDLVEQLDAFLQPRRVAEPRLRWTHPDGWHLTTSFMGDVSPASLDRLVENLTTVADRTPAFRLRLGAGGAFPWPREAKVLWVGVQEGAEALTDLARRCRTAGTRAGTVVDGARFSPHLTLARANRAVDTTRLVRVVEGYCSDGWTADELVLVASHLHDRGNRYEVLERFALGAAQGPPRETTERGADRAP